MRHSASINDLKYHVAQGEFYKPCARFDLLKFGPTQVGFQTTSNHHPTP